ncbi:MAG: O-antigen ligase family protein, partial [Proteobacteria bacterium]|nr:O-antigen ligase family protein [Pseudomonadota bacterium]
DMSLTALMRLMSYALVFFLVFQFCHNPHRAHTTLKWLAVAGTLYALYGLVVYWGNFHVLFWTESEGDIKSVSSTFINRNTYVDYAGMGLLCLMALSLSHSMQRHGPQHVPPGGRQERIESFIFNSWKPFLGLMIISSALISTQSRGGAVACAIGVATFIVVYLVRKKTDTKMLMASLGGMCLIIALAYSISNEVLLKRMVKVDTGGAERITVFKLTIDATRDNPLTGFGYGAFEQGFKTYRNEDVEHLYDKTHNTYLENAFEL